MTISAADPGTSLRTSRKPRTRLLYGSETYRCGVSPVLSITTAASAAPPLTGLKKLNSRPSIRLIELVLNRSCPSTRGACAKQELPAVGQLLLCQGSTTRSEEHTSELQSPC